MQVSDLSDDIVSSLTTAHQPEAFSFANTPEAFAVFFASLYKNPLYALIREGLCNGWDGHIAADNTETPLIVTLANGYLTIQDSGTGIPHGKMQETYCVIGNSTKKGDGRQTGGFGYGCKSPFAYTDNFEVTSFHDGKKVIYTMLRSDPSREGFPSCTPIVALPTTHTGLTLKIPLIGVSESEVQRIIREVAYLGSIKVELNGEDLPCLSMGFGDGEYVITSPHTHRMSASDTNIWVRYGNVIYPVTSFEEYAEDFKLVKQFMSHLTPRHREGLHVIFQASPHTLAVTPSREELSMQDLTKKTIQALLDTFIATVPAQVKEEMDSILVEMCKFTGGAYKNIRAGKEPPALPTALHKEMQAMGEEESTSHRGIALNAVYTVSFIFSKRIEEILNARIEYISQVATPEEAPLVAAWRKHVSLSSSKLSPMVRVSVRDMYSAYWKRAIKAYLASPVLRKKPLWVMQEYGDIPTPSEKRPPLMNVMYSPKSYANKYVNPWGAVANTVVIAFSKKDAYLGVEGASNFIENSGILVYVLPNKKIATHRCAVDTFTQAGYNILDLTKSVEVDATRGTFVARAPSVKTHSSLNPVFSKEGVLALSNMDTSDGIRITQYRASDSPVYIASPKAVIHVPLNANTCPRHLPNCLLDSENVIMALGTEIGVVTTHPQFLKAKTELSLNDFVEQRIQEHISTSERYKIVAYRRKFTHTLTQYSSRDKTTIRYILSSETLQEIFKVKGFPQPIAPSTDIEELAEEYLNTSKGIEFFSSVVDKVKLRADVLRMCKVVSESLVLHSGYRGITLDLESLEKDTSPRGKALLKSMCQLIIKYKFKE